MPWQFVEVYNPLCTDVDMADWMLQAAMSDDVSQIDAYQQVVLSGTLAPGAVFTICTHAGEAEWNGPALPGNISCDAFFNPDVFFDGNDPLYLRQGASNWIDMFGIIPGDLFEICGTAMVRPAAPYGWSRNPSRTHGFFSWRFVESDDAERGCHWIPTVGLDAVPATPGAHVCSLPNTCITETTVPSSSEPTGVSTDRPSSTASPVLGPPPGLFVSEIRSDRTGNSAPWQYIEIYNPTCDSVELSPYWLRAAMAGTSVATRYQVVNLGPGVLAPGDVYTVCTDVGIDHWRDSAAAFCHAFFAAGDVDMDGDDPVFFGRANTHLDGFGGMPGFPFSACGHTVNTAADPAPSYGFIRNRTRNHGISSVRDWDEENMFNPATGCEWIPVPHQVPADLATIMATPGSHDCAAPGRHAGCTGSSSSVSPSTTPSPTTPPTSSPSPTPSPTEPCCRADELADEASRGCDAVSTTEACGSDGEISSICTCSCCHIERGVCSTQLDLMFLLDASRSVGQPRFALEILPFVSSFADRFVIGAHQSRIGVATFSSRGQSRIEIPLNNAFPSTGLPAMIEAVPFSDGLSFVVDGLEVVLDHFRSHQRTTDARSPRCAVPAALVVVLDGHHRLRYTASSPDYYRAIAEAANELEVHGVRVFGVRLAPESEGDTPPQPNQMPTKVMQILGFGYNMTVEEARAARGRTYFEANPGELEALVDGIATGVCNTADETRRQQVNDDGCGQD